MSVIDSTTERRARIDVGAVAKLRSTALVPPTLAWAGPAVTRPDSPPSLNEQLSAAAALIAMADTVAREQVLLTALARVVAAVLDGDADPLSPCLELLAAEGLEVRLWAIIGDWQAAPPTTDEAASGPAGAVV